MNVKQSNLIPTFDKFRRISIEDYETFQQVLKKYPPYSDFNFSSLYAWSHSDRAKISLLNGNLVISFIDYGSKKRIYSFIGNNLILDTVAKLAEYLRDKPNCELKLIPHHVIKSEPLIKESFEVIADKDNHDYIYKTEDIALMEAAIYHKKRNLYKRFTRDYQYQVSFINLKSTESQEEILDVFDQWRLAKGKKLSGVKKELRTLTACFDLVHHNHLHLMTVTVQNKIAGFSIFELVNKNYAILHFQKNNPGYIGINEFLMRELCNHLVSQKIKFLNLEQDMGEERLRYSKRSYRPFKLLKKYRIIEKIIPIDKSQEILNLR